MPIELKFSMNVPYTYLYKFVTCLGSSIQRRLLKESKLVLILKFFETPGGVLGFTRGGMFVSSSYCCCSSSSTCAQVDS